MSSFAPEVIFHLGFFPVTNTILNTLLVDLIILTFIILATKKISLIPSFFQNFTEFVIESFYNMTYSIAGDKAKQIFPYFMSFFLFIFIANFTNLIPGLNTFGIKDHGSIIPLFRGTTSDLNTTLALALIAIVATHMLSIKNLGITEYLSRFLPFIPFLVSVLKGKPKFSFDKSTPIMIIMSIFNPIVFIFVGILELVSQLVNVISLSFRLFGNIYAGEVVLQTISNIFAVFAPLPFLMLEVVVGFVQALVFSMLTLVFMVILTTPHHEESKEVSSV